MGNATLQPIEVEPLDVRFSLRMPSGLNSFIEWIAQKENRSQNEMILRFLRECADAYLKANSLVFISWQGLVEDNAIEKGGFLENRVVIYKTRPQSFKDLPSTEKIPLKLFLSFCLSGINAYTLTPGIYRYFDRWFYKKVRKLSDYTYKETEDPSIHIKEPSPNEKEIEGFLNENYFLVKKAIPSGHDLTDIVILEDETDLLFVQKLRLMEESQAS